MEKNVYLSFKNWMKSVCDEPVSKITLDAGFSCPNRINSSGCIFCDNSSFSPAHRDFSHLTIKEQIEKGKKIDNKNGVKKFIAYFQAFTNTFAPVAELKQKYDEIIDDDEIIGLAIGTRPDCLQEDVLDLIETYKDRFPELLFVEIGMQSANNKTLKLINRGHTHKQTVDAVQRCKQRGLLTVLHVILGLPGENLDDMKNTAQEIAKMKPQSVKIHHLYVYEGTELAKMFKAGKYKPLEYSTYLEYASEFLTRIPSDIVIQRLVGELEGKNILAPFWGRTKTQIIQDLCNYMRQNSLTQGIKAENKS